MKTNFKKSLAVFLAVLILASVFSITTVAASYTVTYKPGEGVEGEIYVDEFSSSIKLRSETYERAHYTHTGWTTTDGGVIKYKFAATYRTKKDLVLYPVWTGDVYDFTYAPGQYANEADAVTEDANYGAKKVLKGAIFTRDGYVQIGWSLTDGGEKVYDLNGVTEAIESNMTLYPYWAQMYSITFTPGQDGVGEEVSELVETGKTFSTKPALFTREGYHQTGWSTEEGGRKVYDLVQHHIVAESDMVLYPYWLKETYSISVSESDFYFGDVCEDYATPESKTFVVTNTGNVPVTVSASSVANYSVSLSGSITLAVGATVNISVQPNANLGFGEYTGTVVITIAENDSIIETVDFEFVVSEHVFGVYKSNNDATYSADGTKTAECVKGCGTEDIIADPGSMKVYSADNNDAVGIADSYIHHRTVRFTAYGSGMDAAEDDNLTKRFRPVSWYVNDDFNGEFEDGYDVVFTHTIFGEYTLTINYVEEELDSTTGEWVETGVADTKTFDYTVGTTAEEEKEIVRPNTILNIIFGLLAQLLSLLGLG